MQDKKGVKNSRIKKVSVVGVIPSFAFQRAKYCALELHRKLPQRFPLPDIVGLLELDWSEKLQEWRQTCGKEYWCLRRPVAVFFDDQFIGSDIELLKLLTVKNIIMDNIPNKSSCIMKNNYRQDYIMHLKKTKGLYCYLDICVDDEYIGTMTFELYSHLLPRTCENFKTLCLGNRGPLFSYKGSRIHRIVKQGWLQGGDIQYKTGGGGFSIFCDPLEDENFGISHEKRGVLSMASGGRHRNGSQFFVTLQPSKWMDTHFVAFGQLIEGLTVLNTLESLETFYECPVKKVEIKSCGKLDLQDVEDVDVRYKPELLPEKKPKKLEAIFEHIMRLVMEALTDALCKKERKPDVLDDGDIPSKMNLQLYFQGFYSLPERILEQTAAYLRKLRRQLYRTIKPSATEIVEVIMYDLQMAVLTRMTTLDEVRETMGYDLYQKMVSGIDMEFETCNKVYVKRLIDQIVTTAENMVDLISKKIWRMKKKSIDLPKFLLSMRKWVESFVLQERFKGDNYFIAEKAVVSEPPKEEKEHPKREGIPCCEIERKKKLEELMAKLRAKYSPEDLCCLGSKIRLEDSIINLYDFFSTCRYGLKRVPKEERYRMPLLDLIEIGRYKLQVLRKQEDRVRSKEALKTDKKVRKWMSEIAYTPELSWLRDSVFPKDYRVLDHKEEIMYGAMTAGLLEMYFFMEEYLKSCKTKRQKLVKKTIYPEESSESSTSEEIQMVEVEEKPKEEVKEEPKEEPKEEEKEVEEEPPPPPPPCTCGHPCCVCKFDPKLKAPPPSIEEAKESTPSLPSLPSTPSSPPPEDEEEDIREELPPTKEEPQKLTCASDETLIDLNAIIAEKMSLTPEEINFGSLKWLKPYILEEGCDLKSEFAAQVHKWFEGEQFCTKGFISKHSLPTRASLLSLSFSLAGLIMDENNLKSDIRNFIYDLWELYFQEMFKEALLEYPPDEVEMDMETELKVYSKKSEGKSLKGESDDDDDEPDITDATDDDDILRKTCKKFRKLHGDLNLDFDKYCKKFGETEDSIQRGDIEEDQGGAEVENDMTKQEDQEQRYPETYEETDHETKQEEFGEYVEDREPKADVKVKEKTPKERAPPYEIEELVDLPSAREIRRMPPYVLPFWVKLLTELTKQALGVMAKVSRLPRRLYFTTDSEISFDDKMKEWFQFNAFNPQPPKGKEMMDFIAAHHVSLTDLEDSARSYLKKKKYSELLNRCTRFSSADIMAEEIVSQVIDSAMDGSEVEETTELFISDLVSSALTSTPNRSQSSMEEEEMSDYKTFDTEAGTSEENVEGL